MAIIKCKMCGGDLKLIEGASTAECEFCGSIQTIPKADDEKKLTLFARANRLRIACEFDKAAGVYESIVADFPEEAEAYWGLVLCKYGIEYVDDPATGKKIPTCHRSSFDSVMEDSDFEQTLENADPMARRVYREEARQIEEIRKGIIAVSANEEPYDIFICYKESDTNGDRTLDSVLAQDIYDALTDKGYRVFFSRITLEDKLGVAYEPYIFAALNSAKIMLVVGTDYEYFNAVWVRNEWSRYLKIISKDRSRALFPCYKNISPYDIPKEFAHLQGQDMGKIGAMQDLLRGIEKHLPAKAVAPATAARPAAAPSTPAPNTSRNYSYTPTPAARPAVTPGVAASPVNTGVTSTASYNYTPAKKSASRKPSLMGQILGGIGMAAALLAILGIGVAIYFEIAARWINPARRYKEATAAMAAGEYWKADDSFRMAGEYKDAPQQAYQTRLLCLIQAGMEIVDEKYVVFGSYEQNNKDDGPEPIEWVPLALDMNRVLLVSRYALDYMDYGGYDTLWENSPVRVWLNDSFLTMAFTKEQQEAIAITTNYNNIDNDYTEDDMSYNGSTDETRDQVFLLDMEDASMYMDLLPQYKYTQATEYAKSLGAHVADNGNTWWSLRSSSAKFVGAESGYGTTSVCAVRPAIWVDLDAIGE